MTTPKITIIIIVRYVMIFRCFITQFFYISFFLVSHDSVELWFPLQEEVEGGNIPLGLGWLHIGWREKKGGYTLRVCLVCSKGL